MRSALNYSGVRKHYKDPPIAGSNVLRTPSAKSSKRKRNSFMTPRKNWLEPKKRDGCKRIPLSSLRSERHSFLSQAPKKRVSAVCPTAFGHWLLCGAPFDFCGRDGPSAKSCLKLAAGPLDPDEKVIKLRDFSAGDTSCSCSIKLNPHFKRSEKDLLDGRCGVLWLINFCFPPPCI